MMGEGHGMKRVPLIVFYLLVCIIIVVPVIYGTLHGYEVPSSDGTRPLDFVFSVSIDSEYWCESRLPLYVSSLNGSTFSLESRLPDEIMPGEYLLFFTKHTGLEVYVDGYRRYRWVVDGMHAGYPEMRISHAVRLYPEDAGKPLRIVYPSSPLVMPRIEIGRIMIGTASSLFHYTFDPYRAMMILIPFTFFLGFSIMLIAFFLRGNPYRGTLFFFSLFVLISSSGMLSTSMIYFLIGNDPMSMSLIYRSGLFLEPFVVFMMVHNICRSKGCFHLYGVIHMASLSFCIYYVVAGLLQLSHVMPYAMLDNIFMGLVPVFEIILLSLLVRYRILGNERFRYCYYVAILLLVVKNITSLTASGSISMDPCSDLVVCICYLLSIFLFILEGVFTYFGGHDVIINVEDYIRKSYHDTLSGLMTRRGLEYWIENILAVTENTYFIVIFDINGMKDINDSCGHIAGDGFISALGRLIKSHKGEGDAGFRFGGDEFMVFLEGDDELRALSFITSVTEAFSGYGGSVSSAYLPLPPGRDIPSALVECDRMLYENKKAVKKGGADDL